MKLTNFSKQVEMIKNNYPGRAIPVSDSFFHRSIVQSIEEGLAHLLKQPVSKVYDGEAEHFILRPLLSFSRTILSGSYDPGSVSTSAYRSACFYTIMAEVAHYAQTKELGQNFSADIIMKSPVMSVLQAASNSAAVSLDSLSKNSEDKGDAKSKLASSWISITDLLNGSYVVSQKDVEKSHKNFVDDVSVLRQIFTATPPMPKGQDYWTSQTPNRYDEVVSMMGKGRLSNRTTESDYVGRIGQIDFIALAMRHLISKIHEAGMADASAGGFSLASALTSDLLSMYALLSTYKHIASSDDNYDMTFPHRRIIPNSVNFASELKQTSIYLRDVYVSASTLGLLLDLQTYVKLWEEMKDFLSEASDWIPPMGLRPLQATFDLWQKTVIEPINTVLPPAIAHFVNENVAAYKSYTGANWALKADWLPVLDDMMAKITTKSAYASDSDPNVIDSSPLIPHLDSGLMDVETILSYVGVSYQSDSAMPMSLTDLMTALTMKADKACQVTKAVMQMFALIDLQAQDLPDHDRNVLHFSLNAVSFQGVVGSPSPACFDRPAPLSAVYTPYKWSSDEARVDSVMKPYLWAPMYTLKWSYKLMSDTAKEPLMFWQSVSELSGGQPSVAEYYVQPVPANYTISRNMNRVAYTVSAFMNMQQDGPGLLAQHEYFFRAAVLMATFDAHQSMPLLTALSANFMLLEEDDDGKNFTIRVPDVPAIYGTPTTSFLADQVNFLLSNWEAKGAKAQSVTVDTVMNAKIPTVVVSSLERDDRARLELVLAPGAMPRRFAFILYPLIKKVNESSLLQMAFAQSSISSVSIDTRVLQSLINDIPGKNGLGSYADESSSLASWKGFYAAMWTRAEAASKSAKREIPSTYDDLREGDKYYDYDEPIGFYPELVVVPHLTSEGHFLDDSISSDSLRQDLIKAAVTIGKRYDHRTREFRFAAFVDDAMMIMDYTDLERQMTLPQPSIISRSFVSDESAPDAGGTVVEMVPTESTPEPTSIVAVASSVGLSDEVTGAPVLDVAGTESISPAVPIQEQPTSTFPIDHDRQTMKDATKNVPESGLASSVALSGDPVLGHSSDNAIVSTSEPSDDDAESETLKSKKKKKKLHDDDNNSDRDVDLEA